ncbi:PEP-CTERM sorting domain-containing protein [Chitiniphilus shinanonensis]|uniref:PEP-CTERM sorting domain-containing protein n=1 Tax=Chitiniphilus shinanonensis TaxID=553088 RepID=UPI003038ED8D
MMKQLGCALALGLSPVLAQAAVIDLLGMLSLDLSDLASAKVSQAEVIRDNYRFTETTVEVGFPGKKVYLNGGSGARDEAYRVTVSNTGGYAVSGIHLGGSAYDVYSYHYFPAWASGNVVHQLAGQTLLDDWGQTNTEGDNVYASYSWSVIDPYSFEARISPAAAQTHTVGVYYSAHVNDSNEGWFGWASFSPATLTFSVYDPRSVVPVPEPATYALMGLGLLGLWQRGRRRRVAGVA